MSGLKIQLERKRRELPWLLLISATLFCLSFVFNILTWGPLSRVPGAGKLIEGNATVDAPLAWTYLKLGRGLSDLIGKPNLAVAEVTADFRTSLAKVVIEPDRAVDLILNDDESWRGGLLAIAHPACPILFLLWVLFTLVRPRTRHTFTRNA